MMTHLFLIISEIIIASDHFKIEKSDPKVFYKRTFKLITYRIHLGYKLSVDLLTITNLQ